MFRREPEWEGACEVFDEHADKAFHRTKRCTVNHHWSMRLVVRADITEIETNGQVVIHLHRAELPTASDDILHDEVNLRSVERSLARLFAIGNAECCCSIAARSFRLVPVLAFTDILRAIWISQSNTNAIVVDAERAEDQLHDRKASEHFFIDLIFAHEEMRVILGESTHACHATDFARLLPPIDSAKLRESHRQIAVTARFTRVNANVVRAIHRFEHVPVDFAARHPVRQFATGAAFCSELRHRIVFDDWRILTLAVVGEVAAGAIQIELADVGREDLEVALSAKFSADEVLQLVAHDAAVGSPKHEARSNHLVDMKESELFAEKSVVTLLRFLGLLRELLEFFLRRKRGAVHTREAIGLFIALPIARRKREHFECANLSGGGHMRTTAEIFPI